MDYSNEKKFDWGIPKIESELLNFIFKKIKTKKSILTSLNNNVKTESLIFKTYGETYWIYTFDFIPWIKPNTSYKKYIVSLEDSYLINCIANSTIFYIYYILSTDCRNFTSANLNDFPISLNELSNEIKKELKIINSRLMISFQENRIERYDKRVEGFLFEYKIKKSKSIIDEIDTLLAQHYGFTDEELDFIINYDIKYRMGKELDNEEE